MFEGERFDWIDSRSHVSHKSVASYVNESFHNERNHIWYLFWEAIVVRRRTHLWGISNVNLWHYTWRSHVTWKFVISHMNASCGCRWFVAERVRESSHEGMCHVPFECVVSYVHESYYWWIWHVDESYHNEWIILHAVLVIFLIQWPALTHNHSDVMTNQIYCIYKLVISSSCFTWVSQIFWSQILWHSDVMTNQM